VKDRPQSEFTSPLYALFGALLSARPSRLAVYGSPFSSVAVEGYGWKLGLALVSCGGIGAQNVEPNAGGVLFGT